jgi:hypothetical protein
MCEFEDMDIIARYPRQQAVDDGVLVDVLSWEGSPVMATAHVRDDFGLGELLQIWHEFRAWKEQTEPSLPEEERLFHTLKNGKKVWVVEDADAFTIMYPSDY